MPSLQETREGGTYAAATAQGRGEGGLWGHMTTEPQQRGASFQSLGTPFLTENLTDHLLLLASVIVTFSDRENIPARLSAF